MQDTFNLSRFVEAQRPVFSRVMDELRYVIPAKAGIHFDLPRLEMDSR